MIAIKEKKKNKEKEQREGEKEKKLRLGQTMDHGDVWISKCDSKSDSDMVESRFGSQRRVDLVDGTRI